MKKIMALAMALMLVLSLCTAAHAEKTVTVKVDATKYLNDKDPGKEKFAFMVWALTAEQMEELELPTDIPGGSDDLVVQPFDPVLKPLLPEIESDKINTPVVRPLVSVPGDGLVVIVPDDLEESETKSTEEEIKDIADNLRKQLMKLPYTIVYNDGTKIPFIDETYTVDNCGEKYYIIAEVQDPSKPFIYDDSIYLYHVEIFIAIADDTPDEEYDEVVKEETADTIPVPGNGGQQAGIMSVERYSMICISPKHGIHENVVSDSEKPEDHFIFNNYVNNEVPVTGDETNFVFLAALAVIGMIGMMVIIRKKNEA